MANNKYFRNSAENDFDEIWRRNAMLEKRISDLEREVRNQDTPPPLPRIDPTTYPSPYEGQRAIDANDEQHTWYSDEAWRKAGAVPLPFAWFVRSLGPDGVVTATLVNPFAGAGNGSSTDTNILSLDTTNGEIVCEIPGIFLVSVEVAWDASGAWSKQIVIDWLTSGDYNYDTSAFDTGDVKVSGVHSACDFLILQNAGSGSIRTRIGQTSGANRDVNTVWFKVVRLGDTPASY